MVLEGQGGARIFGEPALALSVLLLTNDAGHGRINSRAADIPLVVLSFDKAHLLLAGARKLLVDQVARTYRDKPALDIEDANHEVVVGEAVTSMLRRKWREGEGGAGRGRRLA